MRIVKLTFVILLVSVFSGCHRGGIGGAERGAIEVFVSPDGDDGADGTKERPFATIVRARDAVRQLRRDGAGGGITVYLRGGTYLLDETIVFSVEDSAPRGAATEIRFDDDQKESFVEENIIFGNGIKLKHTNYIENNFIIGGQIRIRPETAVGAKVHRNIIYAGSDKDFFYDMKAGLLDLARPDYNLLYCKDRQKGERLLAEARKAGYEKHGVFAEPMFADLANGDLRLKAGSAGFELGIRQIDTSKIGLLDDPAFVRLRRAGFRKAVDTEGAIDF